MSLQDDVLHFWYGPDGHMSGGARRDEWFKSTPEFDAKINARFSETYENAAAGGHDDWATTAPGSLALIILLDQFPRNIFRGTARAFAADEKALRIAKDAIANGLDEGLPPNALMFLYMPYQHSEQLADQDRAIELFAKIDPESAQFAADHRDVIAKFGRFPHRNTVLGRDSTVEEEEYLKDGKSWGQG